jgi:hypothetical protein
MRSGPRQSLVRVPSSCQVVSHQVTSALKFRGTKVTRDIPNTFQNPKLVRSDDIHSVRGAL